MESLILSQTIENNNHNNHNTPSNIFLQQLYHYYIRYGFKTILIENTISIFMNIFIFFFINFITNCIDYNKLLHITINKDINFNEFVDMSSWFPSNNYLIICMVYYMLYLVCYIISSIAEVRNSWKLRKFYNRRLNISDKRLNVCSWNYILKQLTERYNNSNFDNYVITSRIMVEENIIISLSRKYNIFSDELTKFLEWNFIFCFIKPLFNKNNIITEDNIRNYNRKVKKKIWLVAIINLFIIPFILYIIAIYTLVKYGEKIYHNPEKILERQMNLNYKWKSRYYNELLHNYKSRKNKFSINIIKIISNKTYRIINIIVKFINFILGSIFISLILFSLINDDVMIKCNLAFDRNILWFIGILGSIILILRKTITNTKYNHQTIKKILNEIQENMKSINPRMFKHPANYYKLFGKMFKYKILLLIRELFNIIFIHYYLIKWYNKANDIYINDILENHYVLGYVSKYSIFTNTTMMIRDPHSYYSLEEFKENNEEWRQALLWYNDVNNSQLGNIEFNWDEYMYFDDIKHKK